MSGKENVLSQTGKRTKPRVTTGGHDNRRGYTMKDSVRSKHEEHVAGHSRGPSELQTIETVGEGMSIT